MPPAASPSRCAGTVFPIKASTFRCCGRPPSPRVSPHRFWMTFKQAKDLDTYVRKGEERSLVVYADKIVRTETDADTGEESERAIPFMKGYTVFNVEQIDGLPSHYYAQPPVRTE